MTGLLVVLLFLGVFAAFATDLPQQQREAEEVQRQFEEFSATVAFVRDRELVENGCAPEGWTQPSVEEYSALLEGRPSLIPYVHFMNAVAAGLVSVDTGQDYTAWVAAQKEKQDQEVIAESPQ
jgi:hypothetical protein